MKKIEKFLVIEVDYSVLLPKEECNYVSRLEGFGKKRIGYIYCQYIITSKLRGFLVFNALLFKNYKIKGRKTSDIEIYYKNNKKPERIRRLVVKNAKKFINSWKEDITIFKWDNKKFGVPVNMVKNNPNKKFKHLIYKRKEEEK